uniref:Nucleolar protein 14 n=1 Tax=Trichobilharzia regenti TaxID=157069 RepID=A0AA85JRL9_TRIRE|nr:unnamed protein product [Trichobilharzia regenti]
MKQKKIAKRHRLGLKKTHRKVINTRSESLKNDLNRYGKVGGLFDRRLGSHNTKLSESEKLLQRQIVEKLRQLDKVSLESIDDQDPLFKAAYDTGIPGRKLCTADDVEGGIEGQIVDDVFFTDGSSSNTPGYDFKNSLSEKIAVTKLERLKRVEENEEQRERLKTVNEEWNKNIRFLLSKVHTLGKGSAVQPKQSNSANVSRLLEMLTTDKKVVPIGFVPRTHSLQEQLSKFQDMVDSRRMSIKSQEHALGKTSVSTLPILLALPKEKLPAITYISNQLRTAKYGRLKDVVRYLFLAQLAVEYCKNELINQQDDEMSGAITGNVIFCPEIIYALTQMFQLTFAGSNPKNILVLKKSMAAVESCESFNFSTQLLDPSNKLSAEDIPVVRLACIYKIILLSSEVFNMYDSVLPKCVVVNLFRPLKKALTESNLSFYPASIVNEIKKITEAIAVCESAPTPNRLVMNSRLNVLKNSKPAGSKMLKQLGLVPQLEPDFEERLLTSRRSNVSTKQMLQRKVAKEKRCAMRAVRQDSQFLASHQLQLTKKSDSIREKKTKAILNSLRSVED